MKHSLLAGLPALVATGAVARTPPAFTLRDLDGAAHTIPAEWGPGAGIVVLGFAHDASAAMDRWNDAIAPG